jgi:hypothetical protein
MKIRQFTRPARLLRHFEMGFIAGVNRDSERDRVIVRCKDGSQPGLKTPCSPA